MPEYLAAADSVTLGDKVYIVAGTAKPLGLGASRSQKVYAADLLPYRDLYFRSVPTELNQEPTSVFPVGDLAFVEYQTVGTVVGEFNATDPDANATLTYHLVSGAGDSDNSLFTLDANGTLKTAVTFDYESNASTYSIRVRASDEYNASVEGNFAIVLINDPGDDQVALTDENFQTAVNLWFSDEANATMTYGHISDWNISAVTNLDGIFHFRDQFNEDISNWDTSSVTSMKNTFNGASAFNQDIGDWNVSSVTTMMQAFKNAIVLQPKHWKLECFFGDEHGSHV